MIRNIRYFTDMQRRYSVKNTAEMTVLSPYLIRAWEKRYGAVTPERSDGNQRQYSEDNVKRLRLLASAVAAGHRIGEIAGKTDRELEGLIDDGREESHFGPSVSELIDRCFTAVVKSDSMRLEELLFQSNIELGVIRTMDDVISPLMVRIGEGWYQDRLRIYQEHLASAVIRTFLGHLLRSFDTPRNAPAAVAAAPYGQTHELGSLVSAVAAASAGFRVYNLGANLPASEIVQSVQDIGARVLLLSVVFPGNSTAIRREIDQLQAGLPESCHLILGGSSSSSFLTDGSEKAPRNMKELRETLVGIRTKQDIRS